MIPLNGASPATILAMAAALETRSEHPIAQAIVRRACRQGIAVSPSEAFQSLPGLGAEGRVGGIPVVVGNRRLFHARRICTPRIDAQLDELATRGWTGVLVASEGQTIGIIGVADQVREPSQRSMALLRQQGIECLVLLTGDNSTTAKSIAHDLSFDEFRAELLPEDKVAAIEELRRRYGVVAMIGDGVNDAPALAAADVGIAMGAAGTDAALETADVALMADDLLKIPYAIRLSRATLRTIKTNIALSLALKAAFLLMAAVGVATLWMAVVADMGASLVVIANGLRLIRAD